MNEFLRKFDTIRFVAPWSIFRNFLKFFHFFEFKFKFWIWTGFIPDQTGTGPDRFGRTGPVTDGSGNPGCGTSRRRCSGSWWAPRTGRRRRGRSGCKKIQNYLSKNFHNTKSCVYLLMLSLEVQNYPSSGRTQCSFSNQKADPPPLVFPVNTSFASLIFEAR